MKKLIALAVLVAALAVPSIASAHNGNLTVSATCNSQTGQYDVTWTVTATDTNKAPKISASNRASIPVNSALGSSTQFTESVPGSTTSVSANITVKWNDNFTDSESASKTLAGDCKPPTKCPEGYVKDDSSTEDVLVCTRTVEKIVEKIVYQYGNPKCPEGTVAEGEAVEGAIVCIKEKVVPPPTPQCPEGTKADDGEYPQGVVVCIKEKTNTVTVYVDKPYAVEKIVEKIVTVEKVVEKPVIQVVTETKYKTVYKVKYKVKVKDKVVTKVKVVTVFKTKPPHTK